MKRKWFGLVLLGLGAFLLVVGTLGVVWAPAVVKKTPLDVDQQTELTGTVQKLDASTGELGELTPVKVISDTKTDTDASDDDVVLWVQSTCVWMDIDDAPNCPEAPAGEDADPRIVDISTDVYATDRVSGEAVNDEKYFADADLPEGWVPHEGLINKWPFDSEKIEYQYWDGRLGRAVPAVYDREETLLGIDCYVYTVDIADEPTNIAEDDPATAEDDAITGTYDNHIEIWVEPKTGAIQQQTQDQQLTLDDGTAALDLKIGMTEDQQQAFADDANDNMGLLKLITFWVPVIGFVGGGLCVVAGLALLLTSRRRADDNQDEGDNKVVLTKA